MKRRKTRDGFVWSTKAAFRMFLGFVASFVMMSATSTYADEEYVDLSSFRILQYPLPGQLGIADWVVSNDGSSVSAAIDNVPSVFIGDTDVSNSIVEFDFVAHSTDGNFSFVWGWQGYGEFYSMGWCNLCTPFLLCASMHAGSSHPFNPDDHTGYTILGPDCSETTFDNEAAYHVKLAYVPGDTKITISEGSRYIESFTITDTTYSQGRFGFVTYAGASVTFSNLTIKPIDADAPSIDIKANGNDDALIVFPEDNVCIEINLDPGIYDGVPADWWIVKEIHGGFFPIQFSYVYVYPAGWRQGIAPLRQAPLEVVDGEVVHDGPLPKGEYTFHFVIDDNMDGFPDGTWADSVSVIVE